MLNAGTGIAADLMAAKSLARAAATVAKDGEVLTADAASTAAKEAQATKDAQAADANAAEAMVGGSKTPTPAWPIQDATPL